MNHPLQQSLDDLQINVYELKKKRKETRKNSAEYKEITATINGLLGLIEQEKKLISSGNHDIISE